MAAQESAADTGHSVKAATEYVIFALTVDPLIDGATTGDPKVWREVGKVSARTAEAAIRQYAERSNSTTPLTLAAVASRYWVSATLRPSTVTTWEAAG